MKQQNAFLFDLNGTMIDDMRFHIKAWSHILNNDLGAGLTEDEVKVQMYGKNEEVLVRLFGEGKYTPDEMREISLEKERRYQKEYLPHLQLIKGLGSFLQQAFDARVPMAIGSAAITFNINFVLDNLQLRKYFPVVVSADDVAVSKPNPEVFLKAASLLQVKPEQCIVFEDAPKGVESAFNAGMKAIVITTLHHPEEFSRYSNVLAFVEDYTNPVLQDFLISDNTPGA